MPAIIISDYLGEKGNAAELMLRAAGMRAPRPSRETGYLPTDLAAKRHALRKHREEQTALGRSWEVMASSIVVENADISLWGWASPHNLEMLEFWIDVVGDAKLLLLFTSPEEAAASWLRSPAPEPNLARFLDDWCDYHESMLERKKSSASGCMLVEANAFLKGGSNVQEKVSTILGLELGGRPRAHDEYSTAGALGGFLARSMLEGKNRCVDLYRQLNQASDVHSSVEQPSSSFEDAAEEYRRLAQPKLLATADLTPNASSTDELVFLREQLRATQTEVSSLFQQLAEGGYEADTAQQRSESPHGRQEGVTATEIDFRTHFEGSNWHEPEPDGCWAGPGRKSVVRLPQLSAGFYQVDLLVMDTITPEVFSEMVVSLSARKISWRTNRRANNPGRLGSLRNVSDSIRPPAKRPFPRLLSGFVELDDNVPHPELVLNFPRTVSPAEFGSEDRRHLAIRCQKLSISRVDGK